MKSLFALTAFSLIFLTACGSSSTTPPVTGSATPTSAPSSPTSLRDILGLGTAQKCTFATTDDQGRAITGVVLVDKNRFKQTLTTLSDAATPLDVHVISDGDYFYNWNSQMASQGIKMRVPTSSLTPAPDAPETNIDLDQKLNYQCFPTVVSASDFQLPENVDFVDLQDVIDMTQSGQFDLEKLKQIMPESLGE